MQVLVEDEGAICPVCFKLSKKVEWVSLDNHPLKIRGLLPFNTVTEQVKPAFRFHLQLKYQRHQE